jgi:hypothetical protein
VRSLERPGDAAVHRQRDATDIAGFVRDQPGDGVGDVARLDPRGITAASIVDLYPRPDLAFRPIVDIAPTTVEQLTGRRVSIRVLAGSALSPHQLPPPDLLGLIMNPPGRCS